MRLLGHYYVMQDNRIVPVTLISIQKFISVEPIHDKEKDVYEVKEKCSTLCNCVFDHLSKDEILRHNYGHDISSINSELLFKSLEDIIEDLKSDYA